MKNYQLISLLLMLPTWLFSQQAKNDSLNAAIDDSIAYQQYYDCDYGEGNVLIVIKKGKQFIDLKDLKAAKKGFAVRMEAIYSMEFTDGKRYETNIVKNITKDSISITNFYNENAARAAGKPLALITYPLSSLKYIRLINDRMLSMYSKKNILKDYDLIVVKMNEAKLCPAVLTFKDRGGEVKVCHFYLTDQGYDLLYENNGKVYYMEGKVEWR